MSSGRNGSGGADGVFLGGVLAVRLAGELKCLVLSGCLSSDPTDLVQASTVYDGVADQTVGDCDLILLLVQSGTLDLDAPVEHTLDDLHGTPAAGHATGASPASVWSSRDGVHMRDSQPTASNGADLNPYAKQCCTSSAKNH